jgi:hypothetical protein
MTEHEYPGGLVRLARPPARSHIQVHSTPPFAFPEQLSLMEAAE